MSESGMEDPCMTHRKSRFPWRSRLGSRRRYPSLSSLSKLYIIYILSLYFSMKEMCLLVREEMNWSRQQMLLRMFSDRQLLLPRQGCLEEKTNDTPQ